MAYFDSLFGTIELTAEREDHIFFFHPEVKKYRDWFAKTLAHPTFTRRSSSDASVIIVYGLISGKKYLAIVIKLQQRNFILTTYLTSKTKPTL